jgi:hypothetical protein
MFSPKLCATFAISVQISLALLAGGLARAATSPVPEFLSDAYSNSHNNEFLVAWNLVSGHVRSDESIEGDISLTKLTSVEIQNLATRLAVIYAYALEERARLITQTEQFNEADHTQHSRLAHDHFLMRKAFSVCTNLVTCADSSYVKSSVVGMVPSLLNRLLFREDFLIAFAHELSFFTNVPDKNILLWLQSHGSLIDLPVSAFNESKWGTRNAFVAYQRWLWRLTEAFDEKSAALATSDILNAKAYAKFSVQMQQLRLASNKFDQTNPSYHSKLRYTLSGIDEAEKLARNANISFAQIQAAAKFFPNDRFHLSSDHLGNLKQLNASKDLAWTYILRNVEINDLGFWFAYKDLLTSNDFLSLVRKLYQQNISLALFTSVRQETMNPRLKSSAGTNIDIEISARLPADKLGNNADDNRAFMIDQGSVYTAEDLAETTDQLRVMVNQMLKWIPTDAESMRSVADHLSKHRNFRCANLLERLD